MEETGLPVIIAEDPLTLRSTWGRKVLDMIDVHGPDILSLSSLIFHEVAKISGLGKAKNRTLRLV